MCYHIGYAAPAKKAQGICILVEFLREFDLKKVKRHTGASFILLQLGGAKSCTLLIHSHREGGLEVTVLVTDAIRE